MKTSGYLARYQLLKKAIAEGRARRGNHEIEFDGKQIRFIYRGTLVTRYDVERESTEHLITEFSNTPSNKRNMIINENAITLWKKDTDAG